jgi:protein-tyrosine-phosphatase
MDAILPVTEASIVGVAAIRKELPSEVLAIAPSDGALEYTLSKFHATRLALALEIPCPATVFISDGSPAGDRREELAGLRFPIIIKTDNHFTPEGGYEPGRHFIARGANEAQRVLDRLEHLKTRIIAQEITPGSGTGAFLLRFHGKTHLSFAHHRLHEVPYTGGVSSFRESCRDEELVKLGEKLLDAIDYDGVAMVEFRREVSAGRPHFLEVNGRLWGSLALALHCGVDFPAALVQCYQSVAPAPHPSSYRSGVRCRNIFPGEVGHLVSILKPTKGPLEEGPHPPRLRAVVRFLALFLDPRIRYDYFWWSDPLPGIRQAWEMGRWVGKKLLTAGNGKLQSYREVRMLKRLQEKHEVRRHQARYFERPPRRILFLCHGNICRSPFAAAYWNTRLRAFSSTLPEADSAGFHQVPDRRTPSWLSEAAREYKIDLDAHRSRVVSKREIETADAIFVMDRQNYRRLIGQFPSMQDKAHFLGLFADDGRGEIADPYYNGEANVRACCEQLVSSLEGLMRQVVRE